MLDFESRVISLFESREQESTQLLIPASHRNKDKERRMHKANIPRSPS